MHYVSVLPYKWYYKTHVGKKLLLPSFSLSETLPSRVCNEDVYYLWKSLQGFSWQPFTLQGDGCLHSQVFLFSLFFFSFFSYCYYYFDCEIYCWRDLFATDGKVWIWVEKIMLMMDVFCFRLLVFWLFSDPFGCWEILLNVKKILNVFVSLCYFVGGKKKCLK